MRAFDWTLLVISILWCLFFGLQLWVMLNSREVKYLGAKVTVPFMVVIVPLLMWLIIAYRVGG